MFATCVGPQLRCVFALVMLDAPLPSLAVAGLAWSRTRGRLWEGRVAPTLKPARATNGENRAMAETELHTTAFPTLDEGQIASLAACTAAQPKRFQDGEVL